MNSPKLSSFPRSTVWLFLLLLMLTAAFLRQAPLGHEALSGDELFSRRVAMEPLAREWHDIREDLVHPPLYYLLLGLLLKAVGSSALALRLFSLLSGVLTLPVLLWLGNRLPRARWAGWLAAACVAAGRYDVFYSQEARSYAFYTLLVLLLVLWLTYMKSWAVPPTWFWVLGCIQMTALVFTHYVGGLFILLLIVAVMLSSVPLALKGRVLACGVAAFLLFLPWLVGERSVYRAKHGIGGNLDWQGHPGLYDLRQVWATAVGVGSFPGATLLALGVALLLSASSLWLLARRGALMQSVTVLAIAFMGWLTPTLVYVLSIPPLNLPLFALRHVLPATVLLTLLCAFGVDLLAQELRTYQVPFLLAATTCLLLLAAVPTWQVLHAGSSRYPYDRLGQKVLAEEQQGVPAYAVWYYGVGEPVDFYCAHRCVHELPASDNALPGRLLLLYRPAAKGERARLQRLLQDGYAATDQAYFTDGLKTPYGTSAMLLVRGQSRPVS